MVSESLFSGLSEKDQKTILAAGKAATLHSAQHLRDSEAAIKKDLIEKGMEIQDPADGEAEFIKLATEKVWPKYYETIGGKEKLNTVLKELGRDPVQ